MHLHNEEKIKVLNIVYVKMSERTECIKIEGMIDKQINNKTYSVLFHRI